MTEFILCLAATLLLCWVVGLKAEHDKLARQTDRLAGLLKRYLKDKAADPEAAGAVENGNKRHTS